MNYNLTTQIYYIMNCKKFIFKCFIFRIKYYSINGTGFVNSMLKCTENFYLPDTELRMNDFVERDSIDNLPNHSKIKG